MAVDTRDKRASCIGYAYPSRICYPVTDSAIGQEDRQHVGYIYRGILVGFPLPPPTIFLQGNVWRSPIGSSNIQRNTWDTGGNIQRHIGLGE